MSTALDFGDARPGGAGYGMLRWWQQPGRKTRWHMVILGERDLDTNTFPTLCGLRVTKFALNEAEHMVDYQPVYAFGVFLDEPGACRMCLHETKKLLTFDAEANRAWTRAAFGIPSPNMHL